jgi:hypothetical protein
VTLSESVLKGIRKFGSRDLDPIAFRMTNVAPSGPITASSGTSTSLITGNLF